MHREHPNEPAPVPGPSVLTVLMLLSIGVHALRWFAPPVSEPPGAFSLAALQRGEWWTCITYIFTHAELVHLGSNLLLLLLAGRPVQKAAGQPHTIYIFLLSAWAGAALSMILRPANPIIGASGASLGFIGAFSALFPGHNLLRPLRRWICLQLRAKRLFPALLTSSLILEVFSQKGILPSNEAHLVHAGGLVAGWLYGRRLATANEDEHPGFFPLGLRRRQSEPIDHSLLRAGLAHLPAKKDHTSPVPAAAPSVPAPLTNSEFMARRVDPVLDKLYSEGANHLTPEEKAILEEAARRFPNKQGLG